MAEREVVSPADFTEKVRQHWEARADEHKTRLEATSPDAIFKELEVRNLLKYLRDGERVLDVGCGNGIATIEFARLRKVMITGIDYVAAMVGYANENLIRESDDVQQRVRFQEGDVLQLPFADSTFDVVVSERCLINLSSLDDQRRALLEVRRVLQPNGRFVMAEHTLEGLEKLNSLRRLAGLPEIQPPWHNHYLSEADLLPYAQTLFQSEGVDNYSSLYYVASRVFNAYLAKLEGKEPDYYHPINQLAAGLPSFGDYGQGKIFLLRKRPGPGEG